MGSVQGDREGQLRLATVKLATAQTYLASATIILTGLLDPEAATQDPSPIFEYEAEIAAASKETRMDPIILAGLIQAESGFRPEKPGKSGERGLCQIMPGAWSDVMTEPYSRAWEPALNILAGARYWMRQHKYIDLSRLKPDDWDKSHLWWTFVAYNAGPGAGMKLLESGKTLEQLPQEILDNLDNYHAGIAWARAQGG